MWQWQWTPYTVPLLLATVVTAGLAGYALTQWRRHSHRPSRVAFGLLMLSTSVWALGDALQLASVGLGPKFVWRVVAYVGHNFAPATLLVFALLYANREEALTRGRIGVLAAEPLVASVLVAPTTPLHGFIWTDLDVTTVELFYVLDRSFGPWYWLNTAYNYVLILIAIYLLVRTVLDSPEQYRGQLGALGVAIVPPFVANVAWVVGLTSVDFTSMSFAFTGAALAFAVFRYQFLELVPIARDTVVERMRDGYIVADDEGRIVDLNPAACDLLGVTRDAVGRPSDEVVPECAEILADEQVEQSELVFEDGDDRRYVTVRASTLDSGGRLLILHDVTDRKSAERRFQALFEHSSDLLTVLDPDGTIQYQSPSIERIMEYETTAVVGRSMLDFVHPDDRETVADELFKIARNDDYRANIEYRFRNADGEWRTVETRGRSLLDDPAVGGIVANTRDITDRKERERTLERQNERLDQFASVVSHDLRNPLNVSKGYVELAREEDDTSYLPRVEQANERMERIIGDVLTLAREGQSVNETAPVSLPEAVEESWTTAKTGDATLCVETDVTVSADRTRLLRLFENLFRNSIEHGGEQDSGEALTVRVGALEDDSGFYVADDGPGIAPEKRDRVFEGGYTTGDNGTGLGLSIVADIASAHGWDVTVGEGEDGGARFEVTGVELLDIDKS